MALFDRFRRRPAAGALPAPDAPPAPEPQLTRLLRSASFRTEDGEAFYWQMTRMSGHWILSRVIARNPSIVPGAPKPINAIQTDNVRNPIPFGEGLVRLAAEEKLAADSGLEPVPTQTALALGPLHWRTALALERLALTAEGQVQRLTGQGALPAAGTLVLPAEPALQAAVADPRGILVGSGIDPLATRVSALTSAAKVTETSDTIVRMHNRSRELRFDRSIPGWLFSARGPLMLLQQMNWLTGCSTPLERRVLLRLASAAVDTMDLPRTRPGAERWATFHAADGVLEIALRNNVPATLLAKDGTPLLERLLRRNALGDAATLLLLAGAPLPELDWSAVLRCAVEHRQHRFLAAALLRQEWPAKTLRPALDAALEGDAPQSLHMLIRAGAAAGREGAVLTGTLAHEAPVMLRAALVAGLSPTQPLAKGTSPLQQALVLGREAHAEALLHAGAPATLPPPQDAAGLARAVRLGWDSVACALVEAGAPVALALTALAERPIGAAPLPQAVQALMARDGTELPFALVARTGGAAALDALAAGPAGRDPAVLGAAVTATLDGALAAADWLSLQHLLDATHSTLTRAVLHGWSENGSARMQALVSQDRGELLQRLVGLGLPLPAQSADGRPLPFATVQDGRWSALAPVLAASIRSADGGIGPMPLDTRDPATGETALMAALRRVNGDAVAMLLAAGAAPDRGSSTNITPLGLAVASGDKRCIEALSAELGRHHGDALRAAGWKPPRR